MTKDLIYIMSSKSLIRYYIFPDFMKVIDFLE